MNITSQDLKARAQRAASMIDPAMLEEIQQEKFTLKEIVFERVEGPTHEPLVFTSFSQVDSHIRRQASTAPNTGSYDKCKFLVTWSDDEFYDGRFDLKHKHTNGFGFLQAQMKEMARHQGKHDPNYTQEQMEDWISERRFDL